MDETDAPNAKRFMLRVSEELVPTIDSATIPFYLLHDERLKRDRTGVLLRIADAHFILTASHGLKKIVGSNIPLAVGWNQEDGIPILIHDSTFHCVEAYSEPGSKDVVRDIAAIKLTTRTAEKILADGKQPITLHDIKRSQDDSDALFLMFGFPSAWFNGFTETGPVADPLVFSFRPYKGEPSPRASEDYDPNVHALFQFQRDAIKATDGEKVCLPKFKGIQGISGCGIWRIVDWDVESFANWKPEQCKLVAIQHCYFESSGYIQSTWIRYAIDRIIDDYPELKSATDLVYPAP